MYNVKFNVQSTFENGCGMALEVMNDALNQRTPEVEQVESKSAPSSKSAPKTCSTFEAALTCTDMH